MITLEPPRGVPEGAAAWGALGLSRAALHRFTSRAREAVGLSRPVDVLLTTDAVLRRLNREFRGKDKATDVLSFPAPAEIAAEHAGDLAISLQTAARQAKQFGHPLATELRILLLHGLLHLSGMDHESDRGEMAAREQEMRWRLRLPAGLIARVEGGGASDARIATAAKGHVPKARRQTSRLSAPAPPAQLRAGSPAGRSRSVSTGAR